MGSARKQSAVSLLTAQVRGSSYCPASHMRDGWRPPSVLSTCLLDSSLDAQDIAP